MRTIDFSFNGGFPLDQRTLNDKQSAYLDILYALTGFLQIPSVGSHIMYGCNIVGPNITPGMMFIDGELCSFAGAPGDANSKIKKSIVLQNAPFENGTNNPVYKNTIAIVDAAGVAYSDFSRYGADLVYDTDYVHTDNNFTSALLEKLNGIEALAQKNTQADWNQANIASDAFIKNKPTDFIRRLHRGTLEVGDVSNGSGTGLMTVSFLQNVGTANYIVAGSINGQSVANQHLDDHVTWTVRDKTATSFKISFREFGNTTQNIKFDYIILALD